MPANRLASLSIRAIDKLNHLINLQELLQIALEQDQEEQEKVALRIDLLIDCYLSHASCHLNELQVTLNDIHRETSVGESSYGN